MYISPSCTPPGKEGCRTATQGTLYRTATEPAQPGLSAKGAAGFSGLFEGWHSCLLLHQVQSAPESLGRVSVLWVTCSSQILQGHWAPHQTMVIPLPLQRRDYEPSCCTQQKPAQQTDCASDFAIFILTAIRCYIYENSWGNLTAKETLSVLHMAS